MLPILVARQIEEGLRSFLKTSFPVTTPAFRRTEGNRTFLDDFLDREGALLKGPWIEMKLPFRQAGDKAELPFRKLSMTFPPYQHQVRAFERLCGAGARSTLVTTGTGSGKTECFMYPLLDHCLVNRGPGIKAIVIYPMNALAADQARRFARECAQLAEAGLPSLSVGLYTGGAVTESDMGADHVISDRATLRNSPPDILLTNYKMLDFLLLRPEDQPLWQHNRPGVLRYLVVDELHTFDGAQGTDLACLIRRLRAKLEAGSELACVGTSATIGGAETLERLRGYAADLFAVSFDADAVILEDRLKVEEYLAQEVGNQEIITRWPTGLIEDLQRRPAESAGAFLSRASEVWLGSRFDFESQDKPTLTAEAVRLGALLPRLSAFQELLRRAHAVCDVDSLAREWRQRLRLDSPQQAETLLDSLCTLVSAARCRREGGQTGPFLQVRVQLWVRELRRMVCTVGPQPQLLHGDDVADLTQPLHLPLLHCRECHSLAWGAVQPDGDHRLKADLQGFYASWFRGRPDAVIFYPLAGQEKGRWRPQELRRVCLSCRATFAHREGEQKRACPECDGELIPVWMPDIRRQESQNGENRTTISSDCPCCGAHSGLIVLGSQAASLASIFIGELYGSAFNDDRKLIAFSDSVQDAAHRAGFFGARTYVQVLRHALAGFLRERGEGLTLDKVAEEFPRYWRQRLGSDERFVGTFIAPSMEWLQSYQDLKETGRIPAKDDVAELVSLRLSWEVISEFGLRSRIGRTLERTGVATAQPDGERLRGTAEKLARRFREELECLRELGLDRVQHFLAGFLTRARQIGAFYTEALEGYVRGGGNTFLLNERMCYMPSFGKTSRPPAMLSLDKVSSEFENLQSPGSWFLAWFERCTEDAPLAQNERPQALALVIQVLEKEGWLQPLPVRGQTVWGLVPGRWTLTTRVDALACDTCQHQFPYPTDQLRLFLGLPCLKKGCGGHYQPGQSAPPRHAYRAEPHRLVPSEHTALMDAERRHQAETSFMHGRDPWDVNLLSATPTLEMGIDIGDLSSVLLCSMPPTQANYLQRIGRAGRRDGNALALTIAGGRAHDLYFYEEPTEMMVGDVNPPGVFLKAFAVLERQLTAFCFDRWAESGLRPGAIPHKLREVLDTVKAQTRTGFPHTLLDYVDAHGHDLLQGFLELFPSKSPDPELRRLEDEERRRHFALFLEGGEGVSTLGWKVLDRLQAQVKTRQGLMERSQELKNRIAQLQKQPSDEARESALGACRRERQALLALAGSVNDTQTLNFFTDEGLLPNYAFPEEGVTLNSVILRRQERRENPAAEGDAHKVQLSFQRAARSALGELVPEAKFYASAHQLTIDQVDLKLSKPQAWRLCPACQYAENVDESHDSHSVCPRCGSGDWRDVGQRRTLLKLRQVFARADARRDRIADDSDRREPAFYRRQLLVDVPPKSCKGAYRMKREDLPFGFEYLQKVTFREINFGEVGNGADAFQVAGRNEVRTGFRICRECGKVRRRRVPRGQFAHALDCKFARDGVEPQESDWLNSLYLYREFQSEAIRILLPVADVAASESTKTSFAAALYMGLREYFKGEVSHLEITEMQEPSPDGGALSHYLVIYDQVPGGTGYLKELLRDPANLITLLRKAHQRLAACACAEDASKDGCYLCILAYRTSRDRDLISRREALRLLERLLEAANTLEALPRLGGVGQGSILESQLEERFVAKLKQTKGLKVLNKVVHGKPGWWIQATGPGEQVQLWGLVPQVDLGPEEGVVLETRPDFILRPLREKDCQAFGEWAIYLDGFHYHWDSVPDDARKRMAVLASGRRVWTLGWHDLSENEPGQGEGSPHLLLKHRQAKFLEIYDKLLARQAGWSSSGNLTGLLMSNPFQLLVRLMQEPEALVAQLKEASLCNAIAWLKPESLQRDLWNLPGSPLVDCAPMKALEAYEGAGEPMACGGFQEGPVRLGICIPRSALPLAAPDAERLDRLTRLAGLHISLEAEQAEETKDFEAHWRGFWHAANVLQHGPRFTVAACSDMEHPVLNGIVDRLFSGKGRNGSDEAWGEVRELSRLPKEELDDLQAQEAPLPVPGLDVMAGIETAWTAELAWPDRKVGVLLPGEALPADPAGWRVVQAGEAGWIPRVLELLNR